MAGFTVAALLGGFAYVALDTRALAVQTVRVDSTRGVSRSAVLAAARVRIGTPMVRLDGRAVRDRVLTQLPGVAAVSVERVWPSTVRLVVRERTAAVAVPQDGRYQLVDRTGVAYRAVATVPAGLVILRVRSPHARDAATTAGLSALASLPPETRKLITRVDAPTAEQVVLNLRDRRRIVWGGADDAAVKAAVVQVLLRSPGTVIDVSAPGLPTVR